MNLTRFGLWLFLLACIGISLSANASGGKHQITLYDKMYEGEYFNSSQKDLYAELEAFNSCSICFEPFFRRASPRTEIIHKPDHIIFTCIDNDHKMCNRCFNKMLQPSGTFKCPQGCNVHGTSENDPQLKKFQTVDEIFFHMATSLKLLNQQVLTCCSCREKVSIKDAFKGQHDCCKETKNDSTPLASGQYPSTSNLVSNLSDLDIQTETPVGSVKNQREDESLTLTHFHHTSPPPRPNTLACQIHSYVTQKHESMLPTSEGADQAIEDWLHTLLGTHAELIFQKILPALNYRTARLRCARQGSEIDILITPLNNKSDIQTARKSIESRKRFHAESDPQTLIMAKFELDNVSELPDQSGYVHVSAIPAYSRLGGCEKP